MSEEQIINCSVVTTKEAAEIIGINPAAVRHLLALFKVEPMKKSANNFYFKKDVEEVADGMSCAQGYFDCGKIAEKRARDKLMNKCKCGRTELNDGTEIEIKVCPFCGHDRAKIITKKNPDKSVYSFVQCMECKSSSGSSKARPENERLLCEKEVVEKWNARDKEAMKRACC